MPKKKKNPRIYTTSMSWRNIDWGAKTRLFFVTDSLESNEEIFDNLEDAEAYKISVLGTEPRARIRVAMVRNYFFEKESGGYNYVDCSNTFNFIKTLK
jgi:hypothetical protein